MRSPLQLNPFSREMKNHQHLLAVHHTHFERVISGLINTSFRKVEPFIIITTYLPMHNRGPFGGIEKLRQLRLEMNRQPAILLSFESFESLLAVPDNGILEEAGTHHLRLPFSPAQLETLLGSVKSILPENIYEIVQRSCTNYGQLESFLARLSRDLQKGPGNSTLTSLKLQNLQRFCARNWGNWFDNLITQAQDCFRINNYDGASEALRDMKEHVPTVVVYHAFEKFSHGGSLDIVNKGFGPLRAMLLSLNAGTINKDYIENYLKSSRSLQNLIQNMISLSNDLGRLTRSFLSVPDDLKRQAEKFIDSLTTLVNDGSLKVSHVDTNALVDAIDSIIAVTDEIIQKGESVKHYLSKWSLKQSD